MHFSALRPPPANAPWYVRAMGNLSESRWTVRRSVAPSPRMCPSQSWRPFACSARKSVDEIVVRLSPAELQQVINTVGRSPSCDPPGVYAALKVNRPLTSPSPDADRPLPKIAPKKQTMPRNLAAGERARPPQKVACCSTSALRQRQKRRGGPRIRAESAGQAMAEWRHKTAAAGVNSGRRQEPQLGRLAIPHACVVTFRLPASPSSFSFSSSLSWVICFSSDDLTQG
jgi:hypothetical protein